MITVNLIFYNRNGNLTLEAPIINHKEILLDYVH